MLEIRIKTKRNICNTEIIGKATIEESLFSYQGALVVAENMKQNIIENLMQTANIKYEEAEKIFNKLITEQEILASDNLNSRN